MRNFHLNLFHFKMHCGDPVSRSSIYGIINSGFKNSVFLASRFNKKLIIKRFWSISFFTNCKGSNAMVKGYNAICNISKNQIARVSAKKLMKVTFYEIKEVCIIFDFRLFVGFIYMRDVDQNFKNSLFVR